MEGWERQRLATLPCVPLNGEAKSKSDLESVRFLRRWRGGRKKRKRRIRRWWKQEEEKEVGEVRRREGGTDVNTERRKRKRNKTRRGDRE